MENDLIRKEDYNQVFEETIIDSIKSAVEEIRTWPKWKQDLCGIESDYSITSIDLKKILKKCEDVKI